VNRLDPDDPQPAYLQVADALRGRLRDGQLAAGAKLPNHAELIDEYGVSLGTIKRALGVLQSEGLIVSRRGEGAFVRSRPPERAETAGAEDSDVRAQLAALARRVEALERRVDTRP
jgi:DNA-binding GntR family transcriptional regulator